MVRSGIDSAPKRAALLALAVAAAIALGACGGSSTTTVTTTSTPTTPATTSTSTTPTTSTSSNSTTGATTTTSGNVRQAFETALRANLLNQQHLTQARTDCVIKELDQSLSDAEIQQVTQGQFPSSLAKKASQAGVTCAHP
jgi:hypothetical protein